MSVKKVVITIHACKRLRACFYVGVAWLANVIVVRITFLFYYSRYRFVYQRCMNTVIFGSIEQLKLRLVYGSEQN